jgi:uncharacterized membrane protein
MSRPGGPSRTTLGASFVLYLASVALVDLFQVTVTDGSDVREIATQAQVALSIAWVLAGAALFAIGLWRRIATVRRLGLALLTLATVKVFVVDLSAVDVAYRVLSFLGIGLVLLASSFLASRFRDRAVGATDPPA